MEYSELIKERYSVRSFDSTREIEQEKLDAIYKAGILAPTAKNSQIQKIYVLKSKEAMDKAREISPCMYGANLAMLVCYDKSQSHKNKYGDIDFGVQDASIVCTHMMLEAWNQGIGSCWVGYFNPVKAREAFSIPEGIEPICMLPLGYAAEDAEPRADMHNSFKAKDEIFIEL